MKQQNKPRYAALVIRPETLKQAKIACAHTGMSLVDFASSAIDKAAALEIRKAEPAKSTSS